MVRTGICTIGPGAHKQDFLVIAQTISLPEATNCTCNLFRLLQGLNKPPELFNEIQVSAVSPVTSIDLENASCVLFVNQVFGFI